MVILRTPNCPIVLSLGNRVRLRKQSARTHGLMVLGFFVLLFNCPCVMWCWVCGWFAVSISHSHTLIHFIALKCAFDLLRRIWRRYLFMHPKYRREPGGGKTCTNPALHHGRGFPPSIFVACSDMQAMFVSKQAFKQVWTLVHVHK